MNNTNNAIMTKAKSMFGNRLKAENYQLLLQKNNIPEVKKEVVPPKEEYKEIKIDNLKLPGLDEEKPIDIDGKDYLK